MCLMKKQTDYLVLLMSFFVKKNLSYVSVTALICIYWRQPKGTSLNLVEPLLLWPIASVLCGILYNIKVKRRKKVEDLYLMHEGASTVI